jgi:hypothetical protein
MVGGGEDEEGGPDCDFGTATPEWTCLFIASQAEWDAWSFGTAFSNWAGNMWICDLYLCDGVRHNSQYECEEECGQ